MTLRSDKEIRALGSPESSVFVSANAGSGKTTLLVNRVLSLLCHQVAPERILCLTYTNAAAAEMKSRIIAALGRWVMLPDETLAGELEKLHGMPAKQPTLSHARGLFARVLESPEGIRIHTIHGFCQSLLARFPIEAGISPNFNIIEPSTQKQLLREALRHVYQSASTDADMAQSIALIAASGGEDRFLLLMQEVVAKKASFADLSTLCDATLAHIKQSFGMADISTEEDAWRAYLTSHESAVGLLADIAGKLTASTSKNDQKYGSYLSAWLHAQGLEKSAHLETYLSIYRTSDKQPRTVIYTKQADLSAEQIEAFLDEQQRLLLLQERIESCRIMQCSAALVTIAARLLQHYSALKASKLGLDYDDLITLGARLLTGEGAAAWVLFKLDGGIDHLMIDEAQDTSPTQWQIVATLCEEFFAGHGRSDNDRSIFIVGDEKQSIYSFQGADVAALPEMQRYFLNKINDARKSAISLKLDHSYRSTPQVLALVDHIFAHPAAKQGVLLQDSDLRHIAVRQNADGFVQLWPLTLRDKARYQDAATLLAQKIAAQIEQWLSSGLFLPSKGRRVQPGDIMVLVRQRTGFVDKLVRALKRNNIAVAGADRMKLLDNLVVQDLLALARFCLLPEDDLNLAALLKSPLCNVTESALLNLAANREKSTLWHRLQQPEMQIDADIKTACDFLLEMRAKSDFLSPYAFYAHALDGLGGRRKILGRMGQEYAEVMDEFLGQAASYARSETPTMQGFLFWIESGEGEIKRDLEQGFDAVRILTVHAAKGLQAPLVILPDTVEVPKPSRKERVLWLETQTAKVPLLVPQNSDGNRVTAQLKDEQKMAMLREYRRLLYVALTRAEDHLIIAGFTGRDKHGDESWYHHIQHAMERTANPCDTPAGQGYMIGSAIYQQDKMALKPQDPLKLPSAEFLLTQLLPEPEVKTPLSPSRLADHDPAAASPLFDPARAARGQLIHQLLQRLPLLPAESWHRAADHLAAAWDVLTAEQRQAAIHEAMAVLHHPQWRFLFGEQSRAEAAIAGRIQLAGREIAVAGQIDRLAVTTQGVWLVDYKTTPKPPENQQKVPKPYLRQLLLYQRLLQQIYPGQPVRAALLWTAAPSLMPIDDALLDETLLSSYI